MAPEGNRVDIIFTRGRNRPEATKRNRKNNSTGHEGTTKVSTEVGLRVFFL